MLQDTRAAKSIERVADMSKQQTTLIQSPPTRIYTDTEVFREERDRIFATTWQFACHVEKLKNEGDFVTCRVAGP